MGRIAVRVLDKGILQVRQSAPIERVFAAHRRKHHQTVLDKPGTAPDLEVSFSSKRTDLIELKSRLLDADSQTLFLLVMIFDQITNEIYFDSDEDQALSVDLVIKSAAREFKSTLKMRRHFDIEDKDPNDRKYLLVSYHLRSGAARYQILEPVLDIGRIVRAGDSWIHFTNRLEKRRLEEARYSANLLRVGDSLRLGSLDERTPLAGVFSIKNNLKPLGPSLEFDMQRNYYRVGKSLRQC